MKYFLVPSNYYSQVENWEPVERSERKREETGRNKRIHFFISRTKVASSRLGFLRSILLWCKAWFPYDRLRSPDRWNHWSVGSLTILAILAVFSAIRRSWAITWKLGLNQVKFHLGELLQTILIESSIEYLLILCILCQVLPPSSAQQPVHLWDRWVRNCNWD